MAPRAGYGEKAEALRMRVLHAVSATPASTRAETRRNSLLVLALAAAPMAAFVVARGAAGLAVRSGYAALALVAGHVALIIVVYRGLLAFMRSPLGALRPARALAYAAPVLLLLGLLVDAAMAPDGLRVTQEALSAHVPCACACSLLASFAALALLFALRRSQPCAPGVPAALLGFAAGSAAALSVALACARVDALHTLLGHGLPVAILSVICALLGPTLLRTRRLDAGPSG